MITLTTRNTEHGTQASTGYATKADALKAKDAIVATMVELAGGASYATRERDHGFEWAAGALTLRMVDLDEAVGQLVEAFGLVDPARRDSESTPTSAAAFIRSYAAKEWGIADLDLVDEVIPDFVPMGCDDHFPDTCAECGSN